ncbi:ABC transporter permease [Paenibacillus alkalitolerans]|uniref:ABC transporter permease n=1 Tax=Paenibacillus alkalitolerans TaxID=2799335 RepID=UPI0018F51B75|nr:ABC-2 family transporter protein [Paenibacillus alkalitolerans]
MVVLKKFDTIAGWTWPEIALLYSIGLFTYAIGASFSFVQMRELEGQVRSGTFDGILTKPVNPYLYMICRGFNLGYIAHVFISGIVLLWALSQLHIEWTWFKVVYFLLALLSGSMIQAGLMSVIGACSFIWIRTGFLFSLFFRLKDFISYPISVYGTFIQIILVFCLPFAFVNFFPSAFLLSKQTPLIPEWGTWFAPLVGPVCFWIGYKFWMYCADKYQGAGG